MCTVAHNKFVKNYSHVPAVYFVMPAQSAWQLFEYVLPSLPQTGSYCAVQMQESSMLYPPPTPVIFFCCGG